MGPRHVPCSAPLPTFTALAMATKAIAQTIIDIFVDVEALRPPRKFGMRCCRTRRRRSSARPRPDRHRAARWRRRSRRVSSVTRFKSLGRSPSPVCQVALEPVNEILAKPGWAVIHGPSSSTSADHVEHARGKMSRNNSPILSVHSGGEGRGFQTPSCCPPPALALPSTSRALPGNSTARSRTPRPTERSAFRMRTACRNPRRHARAVPFSMRPAARRPHPRFPGFAPSAGRPWLTRKRRAESSRRWR